MAKSKRASSAAAIEKKNTNFIVEQYYAVRSEIRKVTWPTRDEARALTIAVTVGTIVMALFLFLVDLVFEGVITGIVGNNVAWLVVGAVALILLAFGFYANNNDV